MRDNLGNADREKKQDMQGKPVHGFFYHLFGKRAGLRRQAIWSRQTAIK